MILVLTGTNDFARRAELKRTTTEFVATYGDFGLETIDASDVEYGRLLEGVASLPFLAPRRMIIMSNPAGNKAFLDNPEQLIKAVADTTDLIVDERKFDKRLNLFKILKKHASVKEFNDLDEHGLKTWLTQEATKRGGTLNNADVAYLVSRVGANQMGLHNELDKLLAYSPKIDRVSIDMLTEPLPQSSVFDLLDAAFMGNEKRTIELYQDQRQQQVEPQYVMSMIAWQIHIIAVVKFNEKDSPESIASKAKLNPYVVRKTLGLTRNLSQKQVKDLVSRALALDVRLKSEMIDADDAVQHFLISI
jgi:DNA polymerase III delta subunit